MVAYANTLARSDGIESQALEGQLCSDHVHVYISIPSKYAVVQVLGNSAQKKKHPILSEWPEVIVPRPH
jgi:REP element-mobilizing transposase RayT